MKSQNSLKLITWNVNGIRACAKKGLFEFIQEHRPDIFCLQETKAHKEQVEPAVQTLSFPYQDWFSAQRKGYSSVATFSTIQPKQVYKGWGQDEYDKEGRVLISEFPQFELYNIYFPNGASGPDRHAFKQQFLQDLKHHLKVKVDQGIPIVVVGDYNVAHKDIDVYDPDRLSGESGFLPEERLWFQSFLDLGFVDLFRHMHPNKENIYSWWSYKELARVANRGWRIDYICATRNLLPYVQDVEVLMDVTGSDHCPVVANFLFS